MTKKTIGQKIVAFLPDIDISASSEIRGNLIGAAALISEEIDIAVADAFKTGFEQAVSGGKELTRKVPQLKDAIPLVPYTGGDVTDEFWKSAGAALLIFAFLAGTGAAIAGYGIAIHYANSQGCHQ